MGVSLPRRCDSLGKHQFDWTGESDGLWWEEDGCAPVLTAGAVGSSIVVYHPYCMGLPERPFKEFLAKVGAIEFGYWQYDRPAVIARAKGNNPAAIETLGEYLALLMRPSTPAMSRRPRHGEVIAKIPGFRMTRTGRHGLRPDDVMYTNKAINFTSLLHLRTPSPARLPWRIGSPQWDMKT